MGIDVIMKKHYNYLIITNAKEFSVFVLLDGLLRSNAWSIAGCIWLGFLEYFMGQGSLVNFLDFFVFAWFFGLFILGMKWLIGYFFNCLHLVWLFICQQFFLSAVPRIFRQLLLKLVISLHFHITALIHDMGPIKLLWLESLRDLDWRTVFKKCSFIIKRVLFWTLRNKWVRVSKLVFLINNFLRILAE